MKTSLNHNKIKYDYISKTTYIILVRVEITSPLFVCVDIGQGVQGNLSETHSLAKTPTHHFLSYNFNT